MKKIKSSVRFGIRPKLFILVLIGFSLLIGITVWRIGVEAGKVATTSVNTSLEQSSVILTTKMQSRFDSIQETVLSLAKDGRVLPLVYDGESATLQDLSLEFKQALAFDILFVLDSEGVVLARSDRPDAIGHSVANSALFNQALHGNVVHGIIVSQGKLLQIVAAPVFDNIAKDIVRGVVALAYELSPEMALEINKLTASDVSFFIFDRDAEGTIIGVQSTYTTKPTLSSALNDFFLTHKENWKSLYESQGEKTQLLINLEGDEYHAVVHPLATSDGKNLGFVLALRSQTELLKPFLKIQQQVFIVGILCLLVASLLAWFIAHNISRPIISLISVTQKIEEGNYPTPEDYQRSNDEVGVLYDALFRMGNSIKDKAELESYLAQLADDIDNSLEFYSEDLLNDPTEQSIHIKEEDLYNDTLKPDVNNTLSSLDKVADFTPIGIDEATMLLPETQIRAGNLRRFSAGDQLQVDDVIDNRYRIIKRLGVGAMGQVYMVKDIDLNENIALKMLNQQNFSADIIQFFKDEIRLARRITHRNVLRTFDFGTWEGFYYITMEYVHGYDLAHLIEKKGALDINIGVVMARQICSAINAAHEQGIIHRDLKPSNMMINKQGILKIMDFGLAMQVQSSKKFLPDGTVSSNATMIAGTPRFMAPEQFVAGDLDERTDIYAVGIILFIVFTGQSPFQAKGFEEWADMHTNQEPPLLRSLLPSASEVLERVIQKAISKKKEDRYSSIKELLDDLQAV